MSLSTDILFYRALSDSQEIGEITEGRIFNPDRSTEDEEQDKIPYIVLRLESLEATSATKDDVEGTEDKVSVSLLIVERNREQLATLAELVRDRISDAYNTGELYSEELGFRIADFTLTAGSVEMDAFKPCVFQTLTYNCTTVYE